MYTLLMGCQSLQDTRAHTHILTHTLRDYFIIARSPTVIFLVGGKKLEILEETHHFIYTKCVAIFYGTNVN